MEKDFSKEGHTPKDVQDTLIKVLDAVLAGQDKEIAAIGKKWSPRPIVMNLPNCIWEAMEYAEVVKGNAFSVEAILQEAVLSKLIVNLELLIATASLGLSRIELKMKERENESNTSGS